MSGKCNIKFIKHEKNFKRITDSSARVETELKWTGFEIGAFKIFVTGTDIEIFVYKKQTLRMEPESI